MIGGERGSIDVSEAAAVHAALARAEELYVNMRMDDARQQLMAAQTLIRRSGARDLTPHQLARVHLYLAAIAHAQGDSGALTRFSRAAATHDPDIHPDPMVFSPPVRSALDVAKSSIKRVSLVLDSKPSGARAYWDGAIVGTTPVSLTEIPEGKHVVRLEHPLTVTWVGEIDAGQQGTVEVLLSPLPPTRLAQAVARDPRLSAKALPQLRTRSVVVVEPQAAGLLLSTLSTTGSLHREVARGPAVVIARRIVELSNAQLQRPRAETATTQPSTQPSVWRRYWWAWTLAGAAALAAGVAVPLALATDSSVDSRPARLDLPAR